MRKKKNSFLGILRIKLNSFYTLKKEVVFLAILSISVILLNEFLFKDIYSFSKFQYNLGQIIIKLSYSYTSAFLFYFIIVHLPKESKKVKTFNFMNSHLGMLNQYINQVFTNVFFGPENFYDELKREISREDFLKLCFHTDNTQILEVKNPHLNKTFTNRCHYINYEAKLIYDKTHELMLYNDILESEVFTALANLNYNCNILLSLDPSFFNEANLRNIFGINLYNIFILNQNLNKARIKFAKKYYKEADYSDFKNRKNNLYNQYNPKESTKN